MKSTLFKDRPRRKVRMTMMISGAVLIHFAIIGVGALWQTPEPPDVFKDFREYPTTSINSRELPDGVPLVVTNSAPAQSSETQPLVPEIPRPSDSLPTVEAPEMPDPSDVVPAPRPRRLPTRTANSAAAVNPARPLAGGPGVAGGHSAGAAGLPGSGGAGAAGWKTPTPSYPRAILALRVQGATTVRITTDAGGNVATVEIVRSAGNPALDFHTQTYVRAFWKGPPNASRTTEFVYRFLERVGPTAGRSFSQGRQVGLALRAGLKGG